MNFSYSFFLSFFAGMSTLIGFFLVFFNKKPDKIIPKSLAFSSGVMLSVSALDLIPESFSIFIKNYSTFLSVLLIIIVFLVGMILTNITSEIISKKQSDSLFKVGTISMLAIIMHNVPEGIVTFLTSNINEGLGLSLAFSIAMHNIPEGISISVPIFYSTKSKSKAFIYTLVSALSEPFGALVAFVFFKNFNSMLFMSYLYSFIAGVMIYISAFELLNESFKYNNKKESITFLIIGFLFMYISLLTLF